MLKGIKDILDTTGEALTFADAGEMLTRREKVKVLARYHKRPRSIELGAVRPGSEPEEVVISDREAGEVLHA